MNVVLKPEKSSVSSYKSKRISEFEEWMNIETGEIKTFSIATREITDKNFYKVWLSDFISVYKIIGNKKVDVLSYILENINPSDNSFSRTIREIAEATKSSSRTVQDVINTLIEIDFLRRKRVAFYIINPEILVQGSYKKRVGLMIDYKEIENEEKE